MPLSSAIQCCAAEEIDSEDEKCDEQSMKIFYARNNVVAYTNKENMQEEAVKLPSHSVENECQSDDTDSDYDDDEDDLYDFEDYNVDGISRCPKKTNLGKKPLEYTGSSTKAAASRVAERLTSHPGQKNDLHLSHSVKNSIKQSQDKASAPRQRGLTRDTRATTQQVMDQKTVLLLEKLMKWNVFTELCGCISTGKEANVYLGLLHRQAEETASATATLQRAIKVFKTSILVFKNRSKYIEGEFRFRYGYSGTSNPRKMVRQWAEKEFRNLRRLAHQGIRAPVPIELRGHVLSMSFLGHENGTASPRLHSLKRFRDVLPMSFWRRLYVETIVTMRLLFQQCKLVHGDFSEYNLLFHQGHIYVIDVSQSVEIDHPHAIQFLKRDCINIRKFFHQMLTGETLDKNIFTTDDNDESKTANFIPTENKSLLEKQAGVSSCPELTLDDLHHMNEEALNIVGALLDFDCSALSAVDLFYYITNESLPFQVNSEFKDSPWPEFDADEKHRTSDFAVVLTNRPGALVGKGVTKILSSDELHDIRYQFRYLCRATLTWLVQRCDGHAEEHGVFSVNEDQQRAAGFDEGNNTDKAGDPNEDDDDEVFLNTWTPMSLQEITRLRDLEREMDRLERGDIGLYSKFTKSEENSFKNAEEKKNVTLEHYPNDTASFDYDDINRADKEADPQHNDNNTALSVDDDVDDLSSVSSELSSDDNSVSKDKKALDPHTLNGDHFTGVIPEDVDPKEWKRLVKEQNRLKRKNKLPKHIKKKKTKPKKK